MNLCNESFRSQPLPSVLRHSAGRERQQRQRDKSSNRYSRILRRLVAPVWTPVLDGPALPIPVETLLNDRPPSAAFAPNLRPRPEPEIQSRLRVLLLGHGRVRLPLMDDQAAFEYLLMRKDPRKNPLGRNRGRAQDFPEGKKTMQKKVYKPGTKWPEP